ncbi:MAG: thiolase family protein, partial [Deltaproteobacteria bacterium]|nr:thiolase family protein [Deltaproteobacteria bacterium]
MNAYLVEAKRTAIGRAHPDKGLFRNVRADELLAILMRELFVRLPDGETCKAAIDDVYIGCVGQHLEQGKNIARLVVALLAEMPDSVPGVTINRLCASSLQAFNFAATTIAAGHAELLLAGGVEHMTHVPMQAAIDYNQQLLARYEFPFNNMGLTAEKVAQVYNISRRRQDQLAVESHRRALAAQQAGHFAREIIPIPVDDSSAEQDQAPRPGTSLERLAELKSIFMENGTVTAGNSSPLNDGASLTLLASESACKRFALQPRARVVDFTVVGLDPCQMGMGPVPAIEKLLQKNRLTVADIDLFELNEAF